MRITKQLAVFLENKPGMLAAMCKELGKHRINIHALAVYDTVDHAVVRMVVNDPLRAAFLLGERGVLVVESEVIFMEAANRPGIISEIADKLAEHRVNIDYVYTAALPTSKNALVILRVSDPRKALRVLSNGAKKTE